MMPIPTNSLSQICASTVVLNQAPTPFKRSAGRKRVLTLGQKMACLDLERLVDAWAVKYVTPAMCGNHEAAYSLYSALSNKHRGIVTHVFWKVQAPKSILRILLQATWEHEHQCLLSAIRTHAKLIELFKYAEFELPLMEDLTRVWRGTAGVSFDDARIGYSWTTDRDVACWFAMRFASLGRKPLVLYTDIKPSMVAHYNNNRDECEVVLLKNRYAEIDVDTDDWIRGYDRHKFFVKQREV